MKKIQLKGKLSLNKETIAKLNDEQMKQVVGGAESLLSPCVKTPTFACLTAFACENG